MGDKPTEVDCAVFGFLCQLIWASAGSPYVRMLESKCYSLRKLTVCLVCHYSKNENKM